nr:IS3 family transposase [Neoroseomonas oryzicola]
MSLAAEYVRYGYRRITALLRVEGWRVNAKRVECFWRRAGLTVPRQQPKLCCRSRLTRSALMFLAAIRRYAANPAPWTGGRATMMHVDGTWIV